MSEYRPAPARPGPVTAAAILLIVAGALGALGGLLALTGAGVVGGGIGGLVAVFAIVLLAVAALQIWAGIQVLNLREQGRKVAIVLAGISAVLALFSIGRSPAYSIITIAIDAFIIWALVTNSELFRA